MTFGYYKTIFYTVKYAKKKMPLKGTNRVL
jgi:hypothetical protein